MIITQVVKPRPAAFVAAALCAWSFAPLAQAAVPVVRPDVIARYPHDSQAFTQGLLLFDGGLYESTGLMGRSTLRRVNPQLGTVLQQVKLAPSEFGEGLARVDGRLIQLTWKNGVAHEYDLRTFEPLRSFDYSGEGWGLCYNGQHLVMSDGSARLFLRDPESFELVGSVNVTLDAVPVARLNELECLGDHVLANVWQTDSIVEIALSTGAVVTQVDAAGLLDESERGSADVLNGIAHIEGDRFFLTGKLWPAVFEVRLALASGDAEAGVLPSRPATSASDLPDGAAGARAPAAVRSPSSPSCACSTLGRAPRDSRAAGWSWLVLGLALSGARRARAGRAPVRPRSPSPTF